MSGVVGFVSFVMQGIPKASIEYFMEDFVKNCIKIIIGNFVSTVVRNVFNGAEKS